MDELHKGGLQIDLFKIYPTDNIAKKQVSLSQITQSIF